MNQMKFLFRSSTLFDLLLYSPALFCLLGIMTSYADAEEARAIAKKTNRPNIILIFSDDQGWNDVGCFGQGIPTPHIDSLAKEGLKFTNFYVASPVCTPSRFGLLTGKHPEFSQSNLDRVLMPSNLAKGQLTPSEPTIASVLKKSGYQTGIIGKWHLGYEQPTVKGKEKFARLPLAHGFDYFYGHESGCTDYFKFQYAEIPDWFENNKRIKPQGYATDVLGDQAVRFITESAKKNCKGDKPFFLYVPFNAPHYGKGWDLAKKKRLNILQAKPKDLAAFSHVEDENRRVYSAMVKCMDDNIGKMLKSLETNGIEENTLVIFLTDHGADYRYGGSNVPLRGAKADLFEGGIRVPCVMRWKTQWKTPREVKQPCWSLDLFPSLVDWSESNFSASDFSVDDRLEENSKVPQATSPIQGVPLTSTIDMAGADSQKQVDRTFVWKYGAWKAVRKGNWKYVQKRNCEKRLYDLGNDQSESTNLAASQPEKLDELLKEFAQFDASREQFLEKTKKNSPGK